VAARLFGGVAIWERATPRTRDALGRDYADIDLVAHRKASRALRDVLDAEGYQPERTFNAAHGAHRLLYHAADGRFHVDVFLDEFRMSHELDLGARLEVESPTLPAAELLLTKLQVAEVNRKDLSDVAMLLVDHEPDDVDGPQRLNLAEVARVCAADWGLFTTAGDNLERLRELAGELPLARDSLALVLERAGLIAARMDAEPKTAKWKLRARVGRRKRWYETPEEVVR
jgi:hypothetical protein